MGSCNSVAHSAGSLERLQTHQEEGEGAHLQLLEVVVVEEPRPYRVKEEVEVLHPSQEEEGVRELLPSQVKEEVEVPRPYLEEEGAEVPHPYLEEEGVEVPHPSLEEEGVEVPRPYLEEEGVEEPRPYLEEEGVEVPRPYPEEEGVEVPRPYPEEEGVEVPRPYLEEAVEVGELHYFLVSLAASDVEERLVSRTENCYLVQVMGEVEVVEVEAGHESLLRDSPVLEYRRELIVQGVVVGVAVPH